MTLIFQERKRRLIEIRRGAQPPAASVRQRALAQSRGRSVLGSAQRWLGQGPQRNRLRRAVRPSSPWGGRHRRSGCRGGETNQHSSPRAGTASDVRRPAACLHQAGSRPRPGLRRRGCQAPAVAWVPSWAPRAACWLLKRPPASPAPPIPALNSCPPASPRRRSSVDPGTPPPPSTLAHNPRARHGSRPSAWQAT